MPDNCSQREVPAKAAAIRGLRVGKPSSVVLALIILVRTGQALPGELPSIAIAPVKPVVNGKPAEAREALTLTRPMFDLPKNYQPAELPDPFAPGNFRVRGHSLRESEAPLGAPEDLPMLRDTNLWDRLADYRSHGRVRLLTLWEAGDNSVSLQAGKKGEPSLQWTSRSMNRGGATRGLFDRLVSESGRRLHPAPRSSAIESGARTSKPPDRDLNAPNK